MENSIYQTFENQSVEHTGVAQVKSRKLFREIPRSEVIIGGVDLLND